ncbi:pentatricopeptide repeat-containing protein At4g02750-like [Selaginella moellendorffii]|uniref:pentatricopeptide repeat-containing protein At4g02750-like n=1 Tax=Selaginella moellendorffii TaxID=88036 RepID=UPI000D1CECFD|nr:pentatricopeptide repeat-containing protein At4g02750-like [Selaginella moellendorffii]|eukprot:XP_024516126.1 pentatricopeptide repeat-containing protein At4g02750-like [Selaginella moellendorffii]
MATDHTVECLAISVERLETLSYADSNTYAPLLRRCGSSKALELGKRIHRHICKSGHERDTFLGNLLVDMYGRCTRVDDARGVFDRIKRKNRFSWNILVGAYTQNGHLELAREVFDSMPERDVVSWNTMFGAYAQHGNIHEARLLFENMPFHNVVSWNAMIRAYAQGGYSGDAVCLFHSMQLEGFKPNEITFIVVIDAWVSWKDSQLDNKTQSLESLVIDNGFLADVAVGNALMNLYSRFEKFDKVNFVFEKMAKQDVVSWTTLLSAYARNGHPEKALVCLPLMDLEGHHPDSITCITLCEACGELGSLKQCLETQAVIDDVSSDVRSNTKVGNALVTMYGKCGGVDLASQSFNKIPSKDVISWTALITANAINGHPHKAMRVFKLMDLEGFCVDKVAWISMIDACTCASAIFEGRLIHSALVSRGGSIDLEVSNALLSMYAKCGSLKDAVAILDVIPSLDIVGWNAMITAFARSGHYTKTIDFYRLMALEGSSRPNSITFISVLSACSHKGLVKDGISHFTSMVWDYGIEPVIDHYLCMVDLLGRGGELRDAEELLKNMPVVPNEVAWRTLLSACGTNGDIGRGKSAVKRIERETSSSLAGRRLESLEKTFSAGGRGFESRDGKMAVSHFPQCLLSSN